MKRWHALALGLSLAIVVFSVVGFLLPSSYTVERAISVNAPTDSVFATVSDLNTWPYWSPWQKTVDATLVYTHTGEPGTTGSTLAWKGDNVGEGQITLTQTNPADGVFYEISSGGATAAKGQVRFLDKGDSLTRVAFVYSAELGWNPMRRFAGLFAENQTGPQFEAALLRLKNRLEKQP